jgi:dTMP kinase
MPDKQPDKQTAGALIALEGIDGTGKTTQVSLLCERLNARGIRSETLSFPQYDTFFGKLVGDLMRGDLGNLTDASPYLIALPYALDRLKATKKIQAMLADGVTLICNRYTGSNAAFQAARLADPQDAQKLIDWVFEAEYNVLGIPKPTLNIVYTLDFATAGALVNQKTPRDYLQGQKVDVNEANEALQRTAGLLYERLANQPDWRKINVANPDGSLRAVSDIADETFDLVLSMLTFT